MPPKRKSIGSSDSESDDEWMPPSKKAKKPAKLAPKARPKAKSSAPKAGSSKVGESKQSKKPGKKQVEKEPPKKARPALPRDKLNLDPKQQKILNEQLFAAVKSASLDSIKELIKKGADPDAKDANGNPMLFKALRRNDEVLDLLLELGANPDCINAEGHTLLLEAVINTLGDDSTGLLETLLEGGADVNFVNPDKDVCPAIWTMLTNGVDEQVDLFLEHGADVTTCDKDGESILSFLAGLDTDTVPLKDWMLKRYIVKYTRIFKSRGAKLSRSDINKDSFHNPLQFYLESGEEKEARAFVKEYKKGFRGVERPLHVAANNPHMKCLRFLLKSGLFDVDEKDSWGRTALHNAAYCENEDNTRLLLEHGADPNVADHRGETPLEIAKYEKHYHHMDLLKSYGAKRPQRDSDDSEDDSESDEDLIEAFLDRRPRGRANCVIS